MRTTFSLFVAILAMFSGQAMAQVSAPPAASTAVVGASDEAPQGGKSERRFGYTRFGRAPVISNAELIKLFGSKVEVDASDVLALLDGSKGDVFRRRMEESVGWSVFGRANPDPDFMEAVRNMLFSSSYELKEYKGLNCRLTAGQFSGDCDDQMDLALTYAGAHTDYPPTPVGFNILGILVDPIEPASGPYTGQGVRVMFTRAFVTMAENPVTKGLTEVKSQPCLNVSGELVPLPPPPLPTPPPPLPPPPPPAAPLVPLPVVIPPPPPPTVDVLLTKVYVKGAPVKPPKNAADAVFVGTVPGGKSYPAELVGNRPFSWNDEKGRVREGVAVHYLFKGVVVDPNSSVSLDVKESAVPKGWKDDSNGLTILITPDMLSSMKSGDSRLEAGQYVNVKKPCRVWKLPCWAIPVIGGAIAIPFIIPRRDDPDEPQVLPVPKKQGGPGPSPMTWF